MNAIRNLAKSGVASGAIGAVAGGGAAYATGGDIRTGMMSGAAMGAGMRVASPAIAMGANRLSAGAKSLAVKGVGNIRGRGMPQMVRASRATSVGAGAVGRTFGRVGALGAGAMGGLGSMAYATLGSNNSNKTFSRSTLSERYNYQESVRKMKMGYNLQEAMMKKQIWQANR